MALLFFEATVSPSLNDCLPSHQDTSHFARVDILSNQSKPSLPFKYFGPWRAWQEIHFMYILGVVQIFTYRRGIPIGVKRKAEGHAAKHIIDLISVHCFSV
jgi:hypothetical protein